VYGLLGDIRANRHEWREVSSLRDLSLLLTGYRAAVEIHDADEALDFPFGNPGPFAVWTELRYPATYQASYGAVRRGSFHADWTTAIERAATERGVPAFDLFFELVDEFRGMRAAYRFGRAVERVPDGLAAVDVPFAPITPFPAMPWFEQGESEFRAAYPLVAVLGAQPEWHRVWTAENEGQAGVVPVPEADFASSMVVVVEIGARGSSGYDVRVERIVQAGGVLYVCALETRPGPHAVGLPALTYPSTSVATPRFDGPVRVVLRNTTLDGDDVR
jgi:hypothetical protein